MCDAHPTGICGNRRNLRIRFLCVPWHTLRLRRVACRVRGNDMHRAVFAWFAYFAVHGELAIIGCPLKGDCRAAFAMTWGGASQLRIWDCGLRIDRLGGAALSVLPSARLLAVGSWWPLDLRFTIYDCRRQFAFRAPSPCPRRLKREAPSGEIDITPYRARGYHGNVHLCAFV